MAAYPFCRLKERIMCSLCRPSILPPSQLACCRNWVVRRLDPDRGAGEAGAIVSLGTKDSDIVNAALASFNIGG
jgi:hypothetical protein